MTTADLHEPLPGAVPVRPPERRAVAALRLPWLYLVSRRAPAALGLLAGLAALLWSELHWHWGIGGVWAGLTGFIVARLIGMLARTGRGRWAVTGVAAQGG